MLALPFLSACNELCIAVDDVCSHLQQLAQILCYSNCGVGLGEQFSPWLGACPSSDQSRTSHQILFQLDHEEHARTALSTPCVLNPAHKRLQSGLQTQHSIDGLRKLPAVRINM